MQHIIALTIILGISLNVFGPTPIQVPAETYLTFSEFLDQKAKKDTGPSFRYVPSDWVRLTSSPPLIGSFKINPTTTLSVSTFDGTIGNELANINRWRGQIGLPPLMALKKEAIIRSLLPNKIPLRQIRLQHEGRHIFIGWLTRGERHFFVKATGTTPINPEPILSFIERQSWDQW
jgi:hypothetical protein